MPRLPKAKKPFSPLHNELIKVLAEAAAEAYVREQESESAKKPAVAGGRR